MGDQDWETVTFKKKTKQPKNVNQARQTGAPVETSRKFAAGTNKQRGGAPAAKKLEADLVSGDDEPVKVAVKTVTREQAQAIQKARQAKGWTQKELAQRINEKVQVVNEYEQAKAPFNNQIMGKLERQLGVKLRGKGGIGEPLAAGRG